MACFEWLGFGRNIARRALREAGIRKKYHEPAWHACVLREYGKNITSQRGTLRVDGIRKKYHAPAWHASSGWDSSGWDSEEISRSGKCLPGSRETLG